MHKVFLVAIVLFFCVFASTLEVEAAISYDCPAELKNISDWCDDGNWATWEDKIQPDCSCAGISFCGNGIVEAGNSQWIVEQCDVQVLTYTDVNGVSQPTNYTIDNSCVGQGFPEWSICDLSCQCIPVPIESSCGSSYVANPVYSSVYDANYLTSTSQSLCIWWLWVTWFAYNGTDDQWEWDCEWLNWWDGDSCVAEYERCGDGVINWWEICDPADGSETNRWNADSNACDPITCTPVIIWEECIDLMVWTTSAYNSLNLGSLDCIGAGSQEYRIEIYEGTSPLWTPVHTTSGNVWTTSQTTYVWTPTTLAWGSYFAQCVVWTATTSLDCRQQIEVGYCGDNILDTANGEECDGEFDCDTSCQKIVHGICGSAYHTKSLYDFDGGGDTIDASTFWLCDFWTLDPASVTYNWWAGINSWTWSCIGTGIWGTDMNCTASEERCGDGVYQQDHGELCDYNDTVNQEWWSDSDTPECLTTCRPPEEDVLCNGLTLTYGETYDAVDFTQMDCAWSGDADYRIEVYRGTSATWTPIYVTSGSNTWADPIGPYTFVWGTYSASPAGEYFVQCVVWDNVTNPSCWEQITVDACGDGIVQIEWADGILWNADDEECDDGANWDATDGCNDSCKQTINGVCGDKQWEVVYDATELTTYLTGGTFWLCQNPNTPVTFVPGYDGTSHTWSWTCDGTWGASSMNCSATLTRCGDGLVQRTEWEECDPAHPSVWVWCDSECKWIIPQCTVSMDEDPVYRGEAAQVIAWAFTADTTFSSMNRWDASTTDAWNYTHIYTTENGNTAFDITMTVENVANALVTNTCETSVEVDYCGDGVTQAADGEECDGEDWCELDCTWKIPNCQWLVLSSSVTVPEAGEIKLNREGDVTVDIILEDAVWMTWVSLTRWDGTETTPLDIDSFLRYSHIYSGNSVDDNTITFVVANEDNPALTDTCTANVYVSYCGDNIVDDIYEECDNTSDPEWCTTECTLTYCGDGVVQPTSNGHPSEHLTTTWMNAWMSEDVTSEACDPYAPGWDTWTCDPRTCAVSTCGDNPTPSDIFNTNNPNEECDDGQNGTMFDGCTDSCLEEDCHINGYLYIDVNNNNIYDGPSIDLPMENVTVRLDNGVNGSVSTNAQWFYEFNDITCTQGYDVSIDTTDADLLAYGVKVESNQKDRYGVDYSLALDAIQVPQAEFAASISWDPVLADERLYYSENNNFGFYGIDLAVVKKVKTHRTLLDFWTWFVDTTAAWVDTPAMSWSWFLVEYEVTIENIWPSTAYDVEVADYFSDTQLDFTITDIDLQWLDEIKPWVTKTKAPGFFQIRGAQNNDFYMRSGESQTFMVQWIVRGVWWEIIPNNIEIYTANGTNEWFEEPYVISNRFGNNTYLAEVEIEHTCAIDGFLYIDRSFTETYDPETTPIGDVPFVISDIPMTIASQNPLPIDLMGTIPSTVENIDGDSTIVPTNTDGYYYVDRLDCRNDYVITYDQTDFQADHSQHEWDTVNDTDQATLHDIEVYTANFDQQKINQTIFNDVTNRPQYPTDDNQYISPNNNFWIYRYDLEITKTFTKNEDQWGTDYTLRESISSWDQVTYSLANTGYYAVETGDTVYYELLAEHNGSWPADDVVVKDYYPSNLSIQDVTLKSSTVNPAVDVNTIVFDWATTSWEIVITLPSRIYADDVFTFEVEAVIIWEHYDRTHNDADIYTPDGQDDIHEVNYTTWWDTNNSGMDDDFDNNITFEDIIIRHCEVEWFVYLDINNDDMYTPGLDVPQQGQEVTLVQNAVNWTITKTYETGSDWSYFFDEISCRHDVMLSYTDNTTEYREDSSQHQQTTQQALPTDPTDDATPLTISVPYSVFDWDGYKERLVSEDNNFWVVWYGLSIVKYFTGNVDATWTAYPLKEDFARWSPLDHQYNAIESGDVVTYMLSFQNLGPTIATWVIAIDKYPTSMVILDGEREVVSKPDGKPDPTISTDVLSREVSIVVEYDDPNYTWVMEEDDQYLIAIKARVIWADGDEIENTASVYTHNQTDDLIEDYYDDPQFTDNENSETIWVRHCMVDGIVYLDINGNDQYDPGMDVPQPWIPVQLTSTQPAATNPAPVTVTSDPNGMYMFDEISCRHEVIITYTNTTDYYPDSAQYHEWYADEAQVLTQQEIRVMPTAFTQVDDTVSPANDEWSAEANNFGLAKYELNIQKAFVDNFVNENGTDVSYASTQEIDGIIYQIIESSDTVTYALTFENTWPSRAFDVHIEDILPEEMEVESVSIESQTAWSPWLTIDKDSTPGKLLVDLQAPMRGWDAYELLVTTTVIWDDTRPVAWNDVLNTATIYTPAMENDLVEMNYTAWWDTNGSGKDDDFDNNADEVTVMIKQCFVDGIVYLDIDNNDEYDMSIDAPQSWIEVTMTQQTAHGTITETVTTNGSGEYDFKQVSCRYPVVVTYVNTTEYYADSAQAEQDWQQAEPMRIMVDNATFSNGNLDPDTSENNNFGLVWYGLSITKSFVKNVDSEGTEFDRDYTYNDVPYKAIESGDVVTYMLSFQNLGPTVATWVMVTDTYTGQMMIEAVRVVSAPVWIATWSIAITDNTAMNVIQLAIWDMESGDAYKVEVEAKIVWSRFDIVTNSSSVYTNLGATDPIEDWYDDPKFEDNTEDEDVIVLDCSVSWMVYLDVNNDNMYTSGTDMAQAGVEVTRMSNDPVLWWSWVTMMTDDMWMYTFDAISCRYEGTVSYDNTTSYVSDSAQFEGTTQSDSFTWIVIPVTSYAEWFESSDNNFWLVQYDVSINKQIKDAAWNWAEVGGQILLWLSRTYRFIVTNTWPTAAEQITIKDTFNENMNIDLASIVLTEVPWATVSVEGTTLMIENIPTLMSWDQVTIEMNASYSWIWDAILNSVEVMTHGWNDPRDTDDENNTDTVSIEVLPLPGENVWNSRSSWSSGRSSGRSSSGRSSSSRSWSNTVVAKEVKISMEDPTACGEPFIGKVSVWDNQPANALVTLVVESASWTTKTFTPSIKVDGSYVLPIEYENEQAENYLAPWAYTVSYSVQYAWVTHEGSFDVTVPESCEEIVIVEEVPVIEILPLEDENLFNSASIIEERISAMKELTLPMHQSATVMQPVDLPQILPQTWASL